MKNYKQLIKELPSKKVVFAFGRFQPPTIGHELLVNAVKRVAGKDAHVIYASRTQDAKKNPLPVNRKVYYLKRMFPGTNFMAAGETTRTLIEVAKELNKKYKNIIMVAGSDRVPEYKRLLNEYNGKEFNFDTIDVVSAGERDPDGDGASGMSATKMREAAKKGDFKSFKQGLPHTITTVDAKRLMNEVREGMGLEKIKESVKFDVSDLRELYVANKIYKVGDFVEHNEQTYQIIDRGTNYLTVVDSQGNTSKKWLTEVTESYDEMQQSTVAAEKGQIVYKGYATKNFDICPGAQEAFTNTILLVNSVDPVALLNAIKETDEYLGHERKAIATGQLEDIEQFMHHVTRAQEYLNNIGELENHTYIQGHIDKMEELSGINEELTNKTLKSNDKIKVARVIATMLGFDDAEKSSSPEQLVNNGLRKVRTKALNPQSLDILSRMLTMAKEMGIKYDVNLLPPKLKEDVVDKKTSYNIAKGVLSFADYKKLKAFNDPKKHKYYTEDTIDEEASSALKKKAEKSGISVGTLRKVYNRGMAAWRTGHRPGTTPQQWGMARVNSYITKGKGTYHGADKDLREEEVDEACWSTHKQVGMKKKGDRMVPDCVPKEGFDPVPKDKESGLSKKYVAGVSTSTAKARAAHFEKGAKKDDDDPTAYKPAPGDATAETKPSKHTLKYKKMYGEDLDVPVLENEEMWASRVVDEGMVTLPPEGWVPDPDEEDYEDLPELTDHEIEQMISDHSDDDLIELGYDDEEVSIIDLDTGEEVDPDEDEDLKEAWVMNEVLSRYERIKSANRFRRTKAKRQRRLQIALRKTSGTGVINKRARRMAVKMLKSRFARKPLNKLSVAEKERLEQRLNKMKPFLNRIAMRMVPRVRRIERDRVHR